MSKIKFLTKLYNFQTKMIKKKGQISRLSFQQQKKNKGTNTIFFS